MDLPSTRNNEQNGNIVPYLSIITLSENGLNKKTGWLNGEKKDPTTCQVQETHFGLKYKHGLKVK